MCPYQYYMRCRQMVARLPLSALLGFMILLFIFITLPGVLSAQSGNEDYNALKKWQLPGDAIQSKDLREADERMYLNDALYTGWAYERYPNGNLQRASHYLKGRLDGLNLLWYPDGAPQMSATYRFGALHGRFLGWYANGTVIYDMYINRGTYASDNLSDEDDSRASSEAEIFEGEGRDNDDTGE